MSTREAAPFGFRSVIKILSVRTAAFSTCRVAPSASCTMHALEKVTLPVQCVSPVTVVRPNPSGPTVLLQSSMARCRAPGGTVRLEADGPVGLASGSGAFVVGPAGAGDAFAVGPADVAAGGI